jgi:sulfite reductase (NADPH) hemoprotein beta-component
MSAPAKPRPHTAPSVVTANALRDGRVVWLAADGTWSLHLEEARVFPPEAVADGLALGAAAERARIVVGVYAAEVAATAGRPVLRKFRERLRDRGPSVDAEPKPELRMAS